MSYRSSRVNGMAYERGVAGYLRNVVGLAVPVPGASVAADALAGMLVRHPELSVGRNSTVEGLRVTPAGEAVVVECSGSTKPSRSPGLSRACTARKLLGAATQVAAGCRAEAVVPPGYVVVTTALPGPGTSAAGSMKALLWLWVFGWLGRVEVHVFDGCAGPVVVWSAEELAVRYGVDPDLAVFASLELDVLEELQQLRDREAALQSRVEHLAAALAAADADNAALHDLVEVLSRVSDN